MVRALFLSQEALLADELEQCGDLAWLPQNLPPNQRETLNTSQRNLQLDLVTIISLGHRHRLPPPTSIS